jgi:hypothetical protein
MFAAEWMLTTKSDWLYGDKDKPERHFAIDVDGRSAWEDRDKAEAVAREMAILLHLPGTQVGWAAVDTATLHPKVREKLEGKS